MNALSPRNARLSCAASAPRRLKTKTNRRGASPAACCLGAGNGVVGAVPRDDEVALRQAEDRFSVAVEHQHLERRQRLGVLP